VLLRSDGGAFACGSDWDRQCALPPLPPGLRYCHVAAGVGHTLLFRSDGQVVACGSREHGQCDIPPLEEGLAYCPSLARAGGTDLVVQLEIGGGGESERPVVLCRGLGGEVLASWEVAPAELGLAVLPTVAQVIGRRHCKTLVVLGDGRLAPPGLVFSELLPAAAAGP